jgi:hypothetical protein
MKYQCYICFHTIKESQRKELVCVCKSSYHMKCIWKWLVINNICPICKQVVSMYPESCAKENEYIYYYNALSSHYANKYKQ